MPIDMANYDKLAGDAVKAFWKNRQGATSKQKQSGKADQGERAAVTAGKNMDGFLRIVEEIVRRNGLAHAEIHLRRRLLTLPGYFRPTKLWDMLVVTHGRLIAAVEFKSHVGPSFGNNFNNRTEEAIGTALDFWTAYREGAFGDAPRPFLGWLMMIEDCVGSRSPVKDTSPHFPVFKEFNSASYADRYNILCRKLIQEQLYTASTLLLTSRSAAKAGSYSELSEMTGLKNFVSTLAGHIAAEAARS
ncbi:MAG: PaeR7I family type II restriction endonuclease [Sterolibacterium sp.]